MRTILTHSLPIAAVAALTLLPGNVAAQGDHVRLSAHYTALGNRYAAEAKRRTSMAQSFIGKPSRNLGTGMSAHCKQLAKRKRPCITAGSPAETYCTW